MVRGAGIVASRVLERLIRPEYDVVFWGGYFPSAAFYLRRYPYLIGSRQELQFGRRLLGDSDRLAPSFSASMNGMR